MSKLNTFTGHLIKKIIPVIVLEILAAVYIFSKCFVSMADFDVKPDAFVDNIQDKQNIEYFEDQGIVFVPENGDSKTEVYSYEMPLRSGGYEIKVDYETEGIEQAIPEDAIYPITQHVVVGEVSIVSIHSSSVKMSGVQLTTGRTSSFGRGYIRLGRTVPDIQIKISFPDSQKLIIKNIHVRQSRSYQFIRLTVFIIGSVLFDIFILLFIGIIEGKGILLVRKYRYFLFIAGTAFILSAPVFGRSVFCGDDIFYHLMRISHIARELSYGQFPVRIYRDALDGFGYPNPLFYCDTFLYIPAVLYILFVPLSISYNIYVFLVNLATVTSAFFSCRAISRDNRISAVAAVFYCMSEWRIDRITRGASVGAYTAFIFFPLMIMGIFKIYTQDKPDKTARMSLAIGVAGLASCHTLSLEISLLFLIIFAVIAFKKTITKKVFFSLCISGIEALLLSLYYVVPFLVSYVSLPLKAKSGESYIQERGMAITQFIQMIYTGESISGGIGHISLVFGVGMITGLTVIGYCLITSYRDEELQYRHRMGMILIMTLISVFIASCYFPLDMIYDNIPKFFISVYKLFSAIQFPVRYMCITVSLVMLGLCIGLKHLKNKDIRAYKIFVWILCLGSFTAFTLHLGYFTNNYSVEEYSGSSINIDQEIMGGEFLPGFDSWKITKDTDIIAEKGVEISNIQREKGDMLFDITGRTNETANVVLPIFNYGNYHAAGADNMAFPVGTDEEFRLTVTIPAGYSGRVRVYYREPFYWRICELISLLSVFTIVLFGIKEKKRNILNNTEKSRTS